MCMIAVQGMMKEYMIIFLDTNGEGVGGGYRLPG